MATYYGTYGQKVQYLASDPSDPQIGQVWYNSTSAVLKVRQEVATNSWAAGGSLNSARQGLGGAGIQTAALAFGGFAGGVTGATESYNGTAWTSLPATMGTAIYQSGSCGTQTAALNIGGYPGAGGGPNLSSVVQHWNGTSWSSPGNYPTNNYTLGAAGIQTAAIVFGGSTNGSTATNAANTYNGTSFTGTPNLNTARFNVIGTGTQTAALIFGGGFPVVTSTESWNGSSWTTVNSLNTARATGARAGTQTAALMAGGTIPPTITGVTELWNGTSWTSNPTGLATGRSGMGSGGTQTEAIAFGGYAGGSPGDSAATEEWTGTQTLSRTITVS